MVKVKFHVATRHMHALTSTSPAKLWETLSFWWYIVYIDSNNKDVSFTWELIMLSVHITLVGLENALQRISTSQWPYIIIISFIMIELMIMQHFSYILWFHCTPIKIHNSTYWQFTLTLVTPRNVNEIYSQFSADLQRFTFQGMDTILSLDKSILHICGEILH